MHRTAEISFIELGFLLAIANFCDAVSSYLALSFNKNIIELNYYMAKIILQSWYYFFTVKIFASIIFILIGYTADKLVKIIKISKSIIIICKIFLSILIVFFSFISIHNIILSCIHAVSSISTALCQS
jgi:hypothetical protein